MFRIRVGINKFWDFEENCATSIDDERIYTKSGLEAANVAEFIKEISSETEVSAHRDYGKCIYGRSGTAD